MTDPRIIALSSNPGQVEPGPFSEHDLREQWNAQADEFNQWESLDSSEQLAWAQTRAVASVQFASLMQEPAGPSLEEVGPLISWLLEAATQSANANAKAAGMLTWAAQVVDQRVDEDAPDADQAEGPSLADVDELCAEFGFHYDDNDTLEILQQVITAAITLWRAPVAQAVATPAPEEPEAECVLRLAAIIREVDGGNRLGAAALAEAILAHPGFSGCHDGPAAQPAQEAGEELSDQEIIDLADFDAGFDRYDTEDESGNKGVAWECSNSQLLHFARLVRQGSAPDHVNLIGFAFGREPWATWLRQGGCLESAHCELSDLMLAVLAKWGRPTALPAQGEVEELVEFVDELASARILTATYAAQLRRIAAILKEIPALPSPGFQIGPQEYIPHA